MLRFPPAAPCRGNEEPGMARDRERSSAKALALSPAELPFERESTGRFPGRSDRRETTSHAMEATRSRRFRAPRTFRGAWLTRQAGREDAKRLRDPPWRRRRSQRARAGRRISKECRERFRSLPKRFATIRTLGCNYPVWPGMIPKPVRCASSSIGGRPKGFGSATCEDLVVRRGLLALRGAGVPP